MALGGPINLLHVLLLVADVLYWKQVKHWVALAGEGVARATFILFSFVNLKDL